MHFVYFIHIGYKQKHSLPLEKPLNYAILREMFLGGAQPLPRGRDYPYTPPQDAEA
jgi:hypothetical protein